MSTQTPEAGIIADLESVTAYSTTLSGVALFGAGIADKLHESTAKQVLTVVCLAALAVAGTSALVVDRNTPPQLHIEE